MPAFPRYPLISGARKVMERLGCETDRTYEDTYNNSNNFSVYLSNFHGSFMSVAVAVEEAGCKTTGNNESTYYNYRPSVYLCICLSTTPVVVEAVAVVVEPIKLIIMGVMVTFERYNVKKMSPNQFSPSISV